MRVRDEQTATYRRVIATLPSWAENLGTPRLRDIDRHLGDAAALGADERSVAVDGFAIAR